MGIFGKIIISLILLLGALYLIGTMQPEKKTASAFIDKPYFYDDYYMGLYDNEQYHKPEFIFPANPDNMMIYSQYAKLAM